MSRPPVATAMEHYQSQAYQPELEVDSPTFAARVYREVMPRNCCASSPAAELPSTIDFSQHIYPTESAPPIYPTETTSPIDQLPPAAPEQIRVALNSATAITFTSASDNRQTGQQPDYFLGTDGVLRANPNKKQPNADGSINIELQAKNKFETDAKKFADQLQKAAVKDLISYFSRSNPGAKVPQDWLDQLSKEPDLPPPVVPLALDSQPVPDLPPPPIDQPQQPDQTQTQDQSPSQTQPPDSNPPPIYSGGSPDIGTRSGGTSGGGGGSYGGGGGYGSGGGESTLPAQYNSNPGTPHNGDSTVHAGAGAPQNGSDNNTGSSAANGDNTATPAVPGDKPLSTNMPIGAWGGYSNGQIPTSALTDVYGFKVAPGIADNLTALLNAAQQAGVWNPQEEKYATGTYRTYDQQVQLYDQKGPTWAATPGKSMHGWGEAIDFNMNDTKLISWLKDNAEKYGFKNHTKEPWHYSTSGG
ncbi:MAG TPA: M15 family metallopeptidase [Oculatellaceae cyanobacterium]